MKPLTMIYTCTKCGQSYMSPFGDVKTPPDICPPCYRKSNPPRPKLDTEQRRVARLERIRIRRARQRAERVAANIEAHPEVLDACVAGLQEDIRVQHV